MKVKMRTLYAGPLGTCAIGGELEGKPEDLAPLIDGGYATLVVEEKPKLTRKRRTKVETADQTQEVETAVTRNKR